MGASSCDELIISLKLDMSCDVCVWHRDMKSDQERVSKLLTDTVTLLCKNGLVYSEEVKVQGLLGITVDGNEVFIVHINELIGGRVSGGSTKEKCGSSESPARKKNPAVNSSKVVDLTRVADTAGPPSFSSQALPHSPGRAMPLRRQRPPVPATMMVPQQQAGFRMQPRTPPRPRMNPGAAGLPTTPGKQMAANYLAQLKQNAATHGMSPVRMMSPPRQPRPANRQPLQPMVTSHCFGAQEDMADDDDDVVIVGTGHEEPTPSWSSPMRKRPLPSHSSTSPAPPQKRAATQPCYAATRRPLHYDSAALIEQLSSADMADALELTADDVPTSVEDIIKQIVPTTPPKHEGYTGMLMQSSPAGNGIKATNRVIASTAAQKPGSFAAISVLPSIGGVKVPKQQVIQTVTDPVVADNSESTKTADFSGELGIEPTLPNEIVSAANTCNIVAEDGDKTALMLEQVSTEDQEAIGDEPLQPFVYADFACDVDDLCQTEMPATSEVSGVAVFPSSELPADETTAGGVLCCQVPGCFAVFALPAELAHHYTAVHAASVPFLAIPPSLMMPSPNDSDDDSKSSAAVESDAGRWPGIACPYPGCGVQIGSYPGLVMHHRHVHGIPLPASQRRELAGVYRARRQGGSGEAASSVDGTRCAGAGGGAAPHTVTSEEASDSFVCPFSSCGVWSFSREDLVAHVQLNHEGTDVLPSVCKQEASDELAPASQ